MTHATVRIAGYNLPLIGIDQSATEEKCDGCKRDKHLSDVKLDEQGRFMCWSCRMKEIMYLEVCDCCGDTIGMSGAKFTGVQILCDKCSKA